MANFAAIIEEIKKAEEYHTKASMLTIILSSFQDRKVKILPADRKELSEFAFLQIGELIELIPAVETYKEKDEIFAYAETLMGLVTRCYASRDEVEEDKLNSMKALYEIISKERFVENAIDDIFSNGKNTKADIKELIDTLSSLKDEFQKGQLYQGLLHYRNNIKDLPVDSSILLSDYIASEMKRYLDSDLDDTAVNNLEFACDVCKFFINDNIISLLSEVLKLGHSNLNYYAVSTLLGASESVPESVIVELANDLVYANMTYELLKDHSLTSLFPTELSTPEYLAKSDMVHWLIYPTELGKQPDQIEYLGKVKKKEEYYIFRYISDSDNLGDDLKGKWLIGWSATEGNTFSNFDLYSDFEKKTLEKTLKYIKKKLL